MAKIMGLQLKAYKSFQGMDGYGFNANLYLNNKKVAFCYDAGNGGEAEIQWLDINNTKAVVETYKIVNEYYKKYPKYLFDSSDHGKVLELVEDLIALMEVEKWFKNMIKKGFKFVVDIKYNKRTATLEEYDFSKQDVQVCYKTWDDKIEQEMKYKYTPIEFTVYKSLEDFNIS